MTRQKNLVSCMFLRTFLNLRSPFHLIVAEIIVWLITFRYRGTISLHIIVIKNANDRNRNVLTKQPNSYGSRNTADVNNLIWNSNLMVSTKRKIKTVIRKTNSMTFFLLQLCDKFSLTRCFYVLGRVTVFKCESKNWKNVYFFNIFIIL